MRMRTLQIIIKYFSFELFIYSYSLALNTIFAAHIDQSHVTRNKICFYFLYHVCFIYLFILFWLFFRYQFFFATKCMMIKERTIGGNYILKESKLSHQAQCSRQKCCHSILHCTQHVIASLRILKEIYNIKYRLIIWLEFIDSCHW